jgi:hypothetical protein
MAVENSINPWSLGFFSFFLKNGLQMMVGASFVLVMRTNFDERMFN